MSLLGSLKFCFNDSVISNLSNLSQCSILPCMKTGRVMVSWTQRYPVKMGWLTFVLTMLTSLTIKVPEPASPGTIGVRTVSDTATSLLRHSSRSCTESQHHELKRTPKGRKAPRARLCDLKPACLIIEGALAKKFTSPTKWTRASEEDTHTHTTKACYTHRTDASFSNSNM
jgi:hypothetical protein